jgi:hypothetical protein
MLLKNSSFSSCSLACLALCATVEAAVSSPLLAVSSPEKKELLMLPQNPSSSCPAIGAEPNPSYEDF